MYYVTVWNRLETAGSYLRKFSLLATILWYCRMYLFLYCTFNYSRVALSYFLHTVLSHQRVWTGFIYGQVEDIVKKQILVSKANE